MKNWILGLSALLFAGSVPAQSLTKAERKAAIQYINWSTKELKKSLKGLSANQLNFKPATDSWSPQECLYHIAFSESALRGALDQALQAPAKPDVKAEVRLTDDQVKALITDRSTKVKTAPPFEPQNTGFASYAAAWDAFTAQRAKLIELVKTTNADLRNRLVELPFGKMDAYQFILFIAGHTNRHTQQLNEVKTKTGYPQA